MQPTGGSDHIAMSDQDREKQMVVTLHKDNEPDMSFEESAFETVGVSVDNAVPVRELEALADEWEGLGLKHPDARRTQDKCAEDLREVLEQYE